MKYTWSKDIKRIFAFLQFRQHILKTGDDEKPPQLQHMTTVKKRILRTLLIFLALIPITAFAHFILFPQETRSILIDFSGFSKNGRVGR